MEVDRARRVHAIFKRAVDLPRDEREALLDSECAGDTAMKTRVRRLLEASDQGGDFLESPALAPPPRNSPPVPDALGNYLVVGVLGVGGMATVYEAIQENPSRRVALKVMHQSMTYTDVYLRFRLEAEVLARLQHPGIAQIYEAGTAQVGQPTPLPFFAMELIAGAVPITEYGRARSLPLRARVAMLAAVCDAVQHGHQHGVIHRDLKPGNVLVDAEGRPKVIDFGVARVTAGDVESLTRASDGRHLIGTLNYMSPEQCSAGSDIDIRTDVYSLGVLLYEVVCGRLPHDLAGCPLPAAVHAIAHEPARPPALGAAHRDLEAIILKAIEKDPDRRYDSVSALAGDLRRWMDSRPTEARPPGLVDQFRLYTRRKRGVVVAGLSLVASMLLIAVISTFFALRLAEEVGRRRTAEERATLERDEARWRAYSAQIAGALSAMKTGEYQQMRTRLAEAAEPLRGWEWGYLQRLTERSDRNVAGHADMIMDLAASADRKRLATCAGDGSVRLWDSESLTQLANYQSESGARALSVAFGPGERSVITGDEEGVVRLLQAGDLSGAAVLGHFSAPVRVVISLPEGRIAAAAADGSAMVWTLAPAGQLAFPDDQPGGIRGVGLSPDGSWLATFNDDGHLWVRDSRTLAVEHRFEFPGAVHQVRFTRDSGLLAAAGAAGRIFVWSLPDGALRNEISVTRGVNTVRSLAISDDGRSLAAGLIHRGFVLCSLPDGAIIAEVGGHTEAVSGLSFSPDGGCLISASWDRSIRRWRMADITKSADGITLAGHQNHVLGVSFSPDGSMVASASRDGSLRLWDADLAQPIARLDSGGAALNAVAFSPDGSLLVAAGSGPAVQLWDSVTGRPVSELEGQEGGAASVAFDAAGRRVAAGGHDGAVRIWDLVTGGPPLTLAGHSARVNSLRFSPDGATIATASRDKTVRLWNAGEGSEAFCLRGHESDVFAVLFSPDGKLLYSGSRDQTIRVWDVETGACRRTIGGHGQYVTSLAMNPNATRLAAGSWYGEIVLFDVKTLDLIASFRVHESAIRGIAFSPDGRWLASASYDGTVRLLDSWTREDAVRSRRTAQSAFAAAMDRVRAAALFAAGPEAILHQPVRAGLDPRTDPWLRKAVLHSLDTAREP